MGILYPLGFEEQKNPALKDGIRHKIQNLRSLKQKTDGASRCSAHIENIKRQSLNRPFNLVLTLMLLIPASLVLSSRRLISNLRVEVCWISEQSILAR